MKTILYKITGPFGLLREGTIIEAYLVAYDPDQNAGLCFHPPTRIGDQFEDSGCYEFIRPTGGLANDENPHWWVSAPDIHYINI